MRRVTVDLPESTTALLRQYTIDINSMVQQGMTQELAHRLSLSTATPGLIHMLEIAQQEAERLGDKYIGQEHVLLALFADSRSLASQLLSSVISADDVRTTVLDVLRSPEYNQESNKVVDQSGTIIGYMYQNEQGDLYIGDERGNRITTTTLDTNITSDAASCNKKRDKEQPPQR